MYRLLTGMTVFALSICEAPLAAVADQNANKEVWTARQALTSTDARERRLAAEKLGKLQVIEAMPDLAKALNDNDMAVAAAAATALLRFDGRAVPLLATALNAPKETARFAAANALLNLGHKAEGAIPDLIQALKHKDVDLRIQAAATLGSIGPPAKKALPALVEASKDLGNVRLVRRDELLPNVAESAIAAIKKIDPPTLAKAARAAVPILVKALDSKNDGMRNAAVCSLQAMGKHAQAAIPALKACLPKTVGYQRCEYAWVLGSLGDGGERAVLDVIKDNKSDLELRLDFIRGFRWNLRSERQAETLILLLKHQNVELRACAVQKVLMLGPQATDTIRALIDLLGDQELPRARANHSNNYLLTHVIAQFGKEAVPALRRVVKDKDLFRRWQAVRALSLMKGRAKPAAPELKMALKDEYGVVAVEAACALLFCDVEVKEATRVLKSSLRHKSAVMRSHALDAVKRLRRKGRQLIPIVVELLEQTDVRWRALATLERLGPLAEPAVPQIVRMLMNQEYKDRRAGLIGVLRNIGPGAAAAVPVLIECLKETELQMSVTATLRAIGPPAKDAAPALVEILRKNEDAAPSVVEALVALRSQGKAVVPYLLHRLKAESKYDRSDAAKLLGQIGPEAEEAVTALMAAMQDEAMNVRAWAAFALARITGNSKKYVGALVKQYQDKVPRGRLDSGRVAAVAALSSLGPQAHSALPVFIDGLSMANSSSSIPFFAAQGIANLGPAAKSAVPHLLKMLEYADIGREEAVKALGNIGPDAKAAVEALNRLLNDDEDSVAEAAGIALIAIRTKPK